MSEIHNIAAEQALLGALLLNNDVHARVGDVVRPDDFFDGVHRQIFEAITARVVADQIASPTTLRLAFEGHQGLEALGGPAYLVRLAGAAVSIFAAPSYAQLIARAARKRRLAETLTEAQARLSDDEADTDTVIGMVEAYSLSEEGRGSGKVVRFRETLTAAVDSAHDADQRDGVAGVTCGLADLDRVTGGWMPGNLIILAGRPAMGKSAVALSMALAAARAGHGVAMCSLEMTPAEIGIRALASEATRMGQPFHYQDARRGTLGEGGVERVAKIAQAVQGLPLDLTPPDCRDIAGIFSSLKRIKARYEAEGGSLDLVVIDYLQLIQPSTQRRNGSRQEDVSEISAALKAMAMRLNVPIIALSQLSRGVDARDDHRPVLGDLRESGAIEQDANTVIFCYREEYYLMRERPEDQAPADDHADWHAAIAACTGFLDLIIAKNRMGDTPTIRTRFDPPTNTLADIGSDLGRRF